MAAKTNASDINDITSARDLPELHLSSSDIAAIKLSYMELVAKEHIDPVTGETTTGLDRATKKAYKIDPDMTKMFFGVEATRKFEVDPRTGLRKKEMGKDALADDLAFIDASLKSATAKSLMNRELANAAASGTPKQDKAPEISKRAVVAESTKTSDAPAKTASKRAESRPKRKQGSIAHLLQDGSAAQAGSESVHLLGAPVNDVVLSEVLSVGSGVVSL